MGIYSHRIKYACYHIEAGVKITVGHRLKSGYLVRLAVHSAQWPAHYPNERNECIRMRLRFNYIVESKNKNGCQQKDSARVKRKLKDETGETTSIKGDIPKVAASL